ncbi:hypothetical protein [Streptomyces sp. MUSC 125]|uniref:hypothetical protein n=1 Tax=Streptomyces sp. MUSC 125 TaxID=1428624 RepID=UPI001F23FC04|nr:hypothetical protein [Streptomyces sp. MUSC 125]
MIAVTGPPDLTAQAPGMPAEELRRRLAGFARAGGAGSVRAEIDLVAPGVCGGGGGDEDHLRGRQRGPAMGDGSPSDGRDATVTAHLVAYAHSIDIGVDGDGFWPAAARRGTAGREHS